MPKPPSVFSVSSVVKNLRCRRFFEGCEEEVGVELLDVEFGLFAGAGPDHGSPFVVDFEHVALGLLF